MQKITKKVFRFSGGGSSAKMVIDNYEEGDLVIFCDTDLKIQSEDLEVI